MSRCISYNSVQSLSCVWLFLTPWTAAHQASLSITNSQSLLKPMSIELMMPSNHLVLFHPLLLLPSIFPSIRVFSNESVLRIIRWQRIGASASVLSMNAQGCFPLGLTGWISLQCNSPSYVSWSAWATNGVRNLWILHSETKTVCMGQGFESPDSSCCLSWH